MLIQNYYAEDLTESWDKSTGIVTKLSLSFTPDDSSTYLIIASWLMAQESTVQYILSRLRRTTGVAKTFNSYYFQPRQSYPNDYVCGGSIAIDTFGVAPGSQTYEIQYGSSSSMHYAYIKNAKIIAIKLNTADQNAVQESKTTTTGTGWSDKTTLTFTPATAGDYLILAVADMDSNSTTYDWKVQLLVDASAYSVTNIENNDGSNTMPWIVCKKVTLTAASHTMKIQYATENASGTVGINNARIVAIRLSNYDSNSYGESDGESSTANTAYTDKTTLTATPANDTHLILGCAGLGEDSISYNVSGQLIEGAVSKCEHTQESKDATSRGYCFFTIYKATLSATSTTWKIQYKTENAGYVAYVQGARIAVLALGEMATRGTFWSKFW
jgi:hypothetical protein